jgi:hypothetical protein
MGAASEPEHIQQLREAVKLSPSNVPLCQALADALLTSGLITEAVTAYRAVPPTSQHSSLVWPAPFTPRAKIMPSWYWKTW